MSRNRDDYERPRGRGRDDDDAPRRRGGRDDDERGGGRRRFEYSARGADSARKRSEQGGNDYDKYLSDHIKMWKPNDGANTIRILPPTWPKADHYGLDIYVHYQVGPDKQTYLCLHKMKGEKCPICEERQDAQRNGDEKYAKELEAKKRVLTYIVDRDHEKDGLQAWASPWTFDRDLSTISRDRKTGEVLPIDHPDEGYDVEFEKKGAKDRTEYLGVAVARRDSPLGNDKWLDFAIDNPLPSLLQYFEYEHIAKAFSGGSSKSPARDDDDEKPRGRARDDDDDKPRGRAREEAADELTWEGVHGMKSSELDDLVELKDLPLNPKKFDSDEDLADAICEELGITKRAAARGRVRDDDDKPAHRKSGDDDDDDRPARGRLAEMRRQRGD